MAGMTIKQAQEKWRGSRPDKPATWPSRALIRKWINAGRQGDPNGLRSQYIPLGRRANGNEWGITLILDDRPPEPKQRSSGPRSNTPSAIEKRESRARRKAAMAAEVERRVQEELARRGGGGETPPVAGFARSPRRGWPF